MHYQICRRTLTESRMIFKVPTLEIAEAYLINAWRQQEAWAKELVVLDESGLELLTAWEAREYLLVDIEDAKRDYRDVARAA